MGTSTWVVPGPQTIDVPAVRAVRLQLIGGRAEVVAWDEAVTRVEVRAVLGHPLEARLEEDRLTVGYPFLGWDGWLTRLRSYRARDVADVRVLLPRGAGLKVGTAVADVVVGGVAEDVSVGTASGAVRIEGGHGLADVKAVSGGVVVTGHDGAARVSTVSGAVGVDGALPRAEVSTVSGAVRLGTTLATSVMSVNAVSGRVGVELPDGCGLVLTARTMSGRVTVDGADRKTAGSTSVQEQTDATGCWLTVNTISGDVDVRRGPQD